MDKLSDAEIGLFAAAVIFLFLAPAYIASAMGRSRAIGSGPAFLMGLFLSVLGVLIVAAYPARGKTRKCPACAERVKADARVCRYCREELEPAT